MLHEQKQGTGTPTDDHGIALDLSNNEIEIFRVAEPPKSWPFGQYISHRTKGTREQMESLRLSLIANSLKALRRFEKGGSK